MKTRLERGKSMKKKKGFTLIELLAVIVILAIIALIAVPVVMNIISKSNKSAFKDSAYGILKAGENYYMGELLKAEGMTEDKVFDFSKDTSELEINGSKPTGGSMVVNKNGKIAMAIHNGKHCVTKGFEDDDVTITDDVENCKNPAVVTLADLATTHSFTSVDGTTTSEVSEVNGCAKSGICEAGTAFAIKVNNTETYKFYVLSDTGKEVTLIMDRNLYSAEDLANGTHNVVWISKEDYGSSSLGNDKGPLTALAALKERTRGWTNIPKFTYVLKDDNGSETKYSDITGELVTDVRARLPRYSSELFLLKFLLNFNNEVLPAFLSDNTIDVGDGNTWGYWTTTAWHVASAANITSGEGYSHTGEYFDNYIYNQNYGIRPVITLSK